MTPRLPLLAALFVGSGLASPADAQELAGYWIGPHAPLPDSLAERRGEFSITVERLTSSDFERYLLETAERLYPDAAQYGRAESAFLEHSDFGGWPAHVADARRRPGARWWWLAWGPTPLPFALTATAVESHVAAMRELSLDAPPPTEGRRRITPHGSFSYKATVRQRGDGTWEVTMVAAWAYLCGPRCGLWFDKERRVVFDREGHAISVEGDGIPVWSVS